LFWSQFFQDLRVSTAAKKLLILPLLHICKRSLALGLLAIAMALVAVICDAIICIATSAMPMLAGGFEHVGQNLPHVNTRFADEQ
jgi:hypothetical protein